MSNVILSAIMAGVMTTNMCTACQPVRGFVVAPVRATVRVAVVPVRVIARVAVAPVRVLARVQPVRRLVRGLVRVQPVRRLVRGVVRVQPVRRLLRRRPVRRLLFGRRLLGRRCCY